MGVVKSAVDGVHGESFFLGTVFTRLHNRVSTIAGAPAARAIAVDPTTNIFYIGNASGCGTIVRAVTQ